MVQVMAQTADNQTKTFQVTHILIHTSSLTIKREKHLFITEKQTNPNILSNKINLLTVFISFRPTDSSRAEIQSGHFSYEYGLAWFFYIFHHVISSNDITIGKVFNWVL